MHLKTVLNIRTNYEYWSKKVFQKVFRDFLTKPAEIYRTFFGILNLNQIFIHFLELNCLTLYILFKLTTYYLNKKQTKEMLKNNSNWL